VKDRKGTPITDGLFDCGEFISAMPEEFAHIAPLASKKSGKCSLYPKYRPHRLWQPFVLPNTRGAAE
jgi:hypothetical protein